MTGSIPDQSAHQHEAVRPARLGVVPPLQLLRRPWVVPAAVGGTLVLALIASGVISLGSIVFVAPLAGCLLMHLFMGHGAHGGHAAHGGHQGADGPQGAAPQHGQSPVAEVFDPVCRMRVDPAGAGAQGLASRHGGGDVFFCSRDCKDAFDGEPGRYFSA